jgi:hypothetical protein
MIAGVLREVIAVFRRIVALGCTFGRKGFRPQDLCDHDGSLGKSVAP